MFKNVLESIPFVPVYQSAGEQGAGEQGASDPPKPPKVDVPPNKMFTQEELNKHLADEKRKQQDTTRKALDELNALKQRVELTSQERTELEERLTNLNATLLTKEEIAKKDRETLEKKYTSEKEGWEKERDSWKTRFTESTIKQAITSAAVQHNAFNPEQVIAILRPKTRLTEEINPEGKKTGEYITKVKFEDLDNDSKPVVLDLSVGEAVKRMLELPQYANLFKDGTTGGIGGLNRGSPAKMDIKELAKNPAKYREARKQGLIK